MEKKTISQIKSVLSVLKAKDTLIINKDDDKYTIFTFDSKLSIEYIDLCGRDTTDKNGFYLVTVKDFKKVISDDFFCNLTTYAEYKEENYGYENILESVQNNTLGYAGNIVVSYQDIHSCYTLFRDDNGIGQYMYFINGTVYSTNGHFIVKNKAVANIDTDVTLYKDICTLIEKLKKSVLISYGKVVKDNTRSYGTEYNVIHMSVDLGEVTIHYTDASLDKEKEKNFKNMLNSYDCNVNYNAIKVDRKELLTAVKNLKSLHPLGHAKLVVKDRCLSLFDLKQLHTLGGRLEPVNEQKVKSLNDCDSEFFGYFHIEYLEKLIKNIDNDTLYINEKMLGDYAMSFTLHDNDFIAYLMGVRI